VAKDRGIYYVFGTGNGLPILTSTDLVHWTHDGQILAGAVPSWAPSTIPGAVNTWAPDISFFDGVWHVYYAVSTFGAKTSAIGFATSPSLADPTWTDHGPVVESNEATPYNAIDPNIVIAPDGTISLVFGSFNGGIYVVPIDPSTGAPSASSEPLPIASRIVTTWGIEGAFVAQHGGYYYLFVSFDDCCRGSDSTYNIRVGRSRSLDGPFLDDRGVPMLAGGGRVVLRSSGTDRGPGHNAVLNDGGTWRLFFHYYDAAEGGTSRLGILPITWTSTGWPAVHWSDLHPTTIG
jgi:arabinan endo-1,5-alpha-L-arabinosidase